MNGEKTATVKVEVEDELEDQHGPLFKRSKTSSASPQNDLGSDSSFALPPSQYNPLDEPSPLGLRLRKSPSLLDLIQMRLSQPDKSKPGGVQPKREHRGGGAASTSSDSKLKASNFPASVLKIGTWEFKSRHEGDLVAKCYFAKHKLVWEILDGGLKNKIEIQWSDIIGLKAAYPDEQPGTLDVALVRQPLFFRETNPQPRKHTLWQTTADFTGGQASINRQHHLQCPPGFLGKHFEKLIQCDPRLNYLIIDSGVNENIKNNGMQELKNLSCWDRIRVPGLHPSMSMNDLVSHIENQILEPSISNSPILSDEQRQSLEILEEISRCLFTDSRHAITSDEKSVMSRVDSLCCLLQRDPSSVQEVPRDRGSNTNMTSEDDKYIHELKWSDTELKSKVAEKSLTLDSELNDGSGCKQEPGMSRKDSVGDLLLNLPRIASLPQFCFNFSEDFDNQSR